MSNLMKIRWTAAVRLLYDTYQAHKHEVTYRLVDFLGPSDWAQFRLMRIPCDTIG